MNQQRGDFGITYDGQNKEVYVFGGGFHDGVTDHCEKYSTKLNKWTEIKPMTQQKCNVSACILNNQSIFVIGGYNYGNPNDIDIEKYSINFDSWETIAIAGDQLLTPRHHVFSM